MRRVSGPQASSSNFYFKKDSTNRLRSPNNIKAKSRGKIGQQSINSHALPTRKNNSFSKMEPNQSSTFFTTHNNKSKKSDGGSKKSKDLKKYEKQIMQILHQSASIIQREWRKYLIRKYRSSLQEKDRKNQIRKKVPYKEVDAISGRTSQNSQAYNSKKYCSLEEEERRKTNEGSFKFNRNVFSFNLSDSKGKVNQFSQKQISAKQQKNIVRTNESGHIRTRSDQPFVALLNNKKKVMEQKQQKESIQPKILGMVPRTVNIVVEGQSPQKIQKKAKSKNRKKNQEDEPKKYEDHYIKNEEGALEEILKKIQNKLEEKKLKKILALENSFSSNLMTFRSYQKNIQNVAEEHSKKLSILQNKKKKFLDQFVRMCEKKIQQIAQQKQDQQAIKIETTDKKSHSGMAQVENHDLDLSFHQDHSVFNSRSIVFEQWELDVQFSDKKIVEKPPIFSKGEKKDDEIFIEDNDKQSTIINQLNEENSSFFYSAQKANSNQKINSHTEKQPLLNEKPKPDPLTNAAIAQKSSQILSNNKNTIQKSQNQSPRKDKAKVEAIQFKNQNLSSPKKQPIVAKEKPIKQWTEQQIEEQLRKFHPINANIDLVNNWLLQISHFILDNFGGEFLRKLIHIEQPPSQELLKHCMSGQPIQKQYLLISQKIFKQFEFFHIKTLITEERVMEDKKQTYSALMLTFHQALYECLNKMLLDELIEGRNWINYPWSNEFKVKKLVGSDHSKQALQKAINRVSNISDYNILPLDPNQIGRDYEQTQQNLIFAQQIKQIPLECEIRRGFLIYTISQQIQKQIWFQQTSILYKFLS